MELPKSVGVMILPGVHLFPQALLPLFIFEPRYRRMLRDALGSHRLFCVAMQQRNPDRELPSAVAGIGLIRASVENPDGTSNLILQGLARVTLGRVMRRRPYLTHAIQKLDSEPPNPTRASALAGRVRELVNRRFAQGLPPPLKHLGVVAGGASGQTPAQEILRSLEEITDASVLADLVSCTLLSDPVQRQTLLETVNVEARLKHLISYLDPEPEPEPPGGAPA